MIGAAAAAWFGLRGVFGATTLVYGSIVLMALYVLRQRALARPRLEADLRALGDD
jgi:hypothetical protein